MKVSFRVDGKPQAKQRPRFTRGHVYTPLLRSQGLNIITDYETSKNRYGKPVTYGVYKLVKANE